MGLFNKIFKKKDKDENNENNDKKSTTPPSSPIKSNSSKDLGKLNNSSSKDLGKLTKNSSKSLGKLTYQEDCEEIVLNNIVIDNHFLLDNSSRFNVLASNTCDDKSNIFYKVWRTATILQIIFKHYAINSIPTQSSVITFTDLFNKKLTIGYIPETSKSVTFGRKFNNGGANLDVGAIPSSITYLKFGDDFSPLAIHAGVLPSSIKTLIFGQYFHTAFARIFLPDSIETLVLARCNSELLVEKIPDSVTNLTLGEVNGRTLTAGDIKPSVTTLSLDQSFTNKNAILEPNAIPNTVKTLIFGPSYNQLPAPGCIPDSVASLTFGDAWNHPVTPGLIGPNVGMLVFGEAFNQTITVGSLPDCVSILEFKNYNKPFLFGALPNSIIYLDLGKSYNQPLANLPENLKSLKLGRSFKRQITFDSLPSSISEIYLVPDFDKTLISYDIPKNIIKILENN